FTAHHVTQSWRMGLWAVAAVDRVLVLGRGSLPLALGRAPAGGLLVVLGVLALGGTAVVVGRRRRVPFAVFLGAVAVGGTAVAVVASTRVVGLLLNYLVIWALAVPVAALLGAVIAVVAPGPAPVVASPGRRGHVLAWVMAALALVAAAGFTLRQAQLPSPGHISDPAVAQIWRDVAPRLGPPGTPLHVNTAGVDLGREQTFIGLVALLELRGYHPKVNKAWLAVFGPASLWHGARTSTRVFLAPYPQSDAGPGFVGRVGDTDVVVLRGT
ncbi:MAG TPA: hypothetical protein VMB72_03625, partial [Acidimicrobiales bacterium]|nr:hypothetical protein [Acidimicrobiales bacterium]